MNRRKVVTMSLALLVVGFLLPQVVKAQFADPTDPTEALLNHDIDIEEAKKQCEVQVSIEESAVCPRLVGEKYKDYETCVEALIQQCLQDIAARAEDVEKDKVNTEAVEVRAQTRTLLPNNILSGVRSLNQLGVSNISDFSSRVVRVALSFMGTLALVMFIYGGILWMFSQGNSEKAAHATKVIVWSALGVIVIVSSYAIINFILEAFT